MKYPIFPVILTVVTAVSGHAFAQSTSSPSSDVIIQRLDALDKRNDTLDKRNDELNRRNARLESENAALRDRVRLLEVGKREPASASPTSLPPIAAGAMAMVTTSSSRAAYAAYRATPPVAYSWTGVYVGANVGLGAGSSNNDWNVFAASSVIAGPVGSICGQPSIFGTTSGALCASGSDTNRQFGAIGGFQAGYNWQFEKMLVGFETDIQISGQKAASTFSTTFIPPYFNLGIGPGTLSAAYTEKLPWLGTSRARAGLVVADRWLVYVTGGAAFGQATLDGTATVTGVCGVSGICPLASWSNSTTKVGWTVGGGIEASIGNNWSLKGEYLHVDLGTVSTSFTTLPVCPGPGSCFNVSPGMATISSRITDEIVRVGLNYRLSP